MNCNDCFSSLGSLQCFGPFNYCFHPLDSVRTSKVARLLQFQSIQCQLWADNGGDSMAAFARGTDEDLWCSFSHCEGKCSFAETYFTLGISPKLVN